MTVERSKRRFLIPIVFATKCFKKPLLISELLNHFRKQFLGMRLFEIDGKPGFVGYLQIGIKGGISVPSL